MSTSRSRARRRSIVLALAAAAVPLPALATDKYWVGGSNYWDLNLWSLTPGGPGGQSEPANGENAIISASTTITVTRDNVSPAYSSPGMFVVRLENTGTNLTTLQLLPTANSLFSSQLQIANSGRALLDHQGGSNSMSDLFLGLSAGSDGAYALSGSGTLNVNGSASVGYFGAGTFNQSGGTHTLATGELSLGSFSTGVGAYNLSGGTLTAPNVYLGGYTGAAGGTGTLYLPGGTMTVAGTVKSWNAASTISLSGGTLSAGSLVLPTWGNLGFNKGTLNLTGGVSSNAGNLFIGSAAGTSTVNLSAGAMAVASGNFQSLGIVPDSNVVFNHTGGTNTTSVLYLGFEAGASATYALGGTGSLNVNSNEFVGLSGAGTFNQTGGTHVIAAGASNYLSVGALASGIGAINLSGGTLDAPNVYLGGDDSNYGGTGTLNITGGTMTVAGTIKSWNDSSTITLNGGTLSVGSINPGYTWSRLQFVKGTLNFTGGNSISGGNLMIGSGTALSTVNLNAGSLTVGSVESTGGGGGVVIFNQTGGAHYASSLYLFSAAGGAYNLSGGTLSATGESVGTMVFSQTGGSNTPNHLQVGIYQAGDSPTYNLIAGTLSGTEDESVGYESTGILNHSGGTNTTPVLIIGRASGNGTYNLSGGTLSVGVEVIGLSGVGVFNQTGGTHTVTGTNGVELAINQAGTLNLSGGTFTTANVYLGYDSPFSTAPGIINITGGTMTVSGMARSWNTASTITLGGGTMNAGSVVLPNWNQLVMNAGRLNLTGGSSANTGNLSIGVSTGAATLNLAAGTLTAPDVFLGGNSTASLGGTGTLMLSGGVMTVPGTIKSWNAASGINLGGGTLNAGALTLANWSGLSLTGGTLNLTGGSSTGPGTMTIGVAGTLSGYGTVAAGAISNAGTLTARYGNLIVNSATLTNTGTLANAAGASLFVQSTSVANSGNVTVNIGGAAVFDAPLGIAAGKTLSLLGGGLATPTLSNSGTVSGFGQISGNFTNSGTATLLGPTQLVGTLTNNAAGQITVRNSQLLITGAAANSGTIRAVSGGTVVFDGGLSGNPVLPGPLADAPQGGPLALTLPQSGTVVLDPGGAMTASYVRQSSITMGGNAGDAASYAKLTIRKKVDGGNTSAVNALAIATDGGGNPLARIDLADTAMVIDYTGSSPASSVRALLTAGYSGGAWAGNGITSSSAALAPLDRALGYAEASSALNLSGVQTATFQGQEVDATSVLVRYTVLGDATLDGSVNFDDLVQVAQNYEGGTGKTWYLGDFNYDGQVTFDDLVNVAQHYETGLPGALPSSASTGFASDWALAQQASVPEPGILGLLAAGGLLTLRRRRRC